MSDQKTNSESPKQNQPKHSSTYLIKEIALVIFTTLLSVLSWFLLADVFQVKFLLDNFAVASLNTDSIIALTLTILCFLVWLAWVIISAALITRKRDLFFLCLLNSAALFIFFGFNIYSGLAFLLLLYILVHYGTKVFLESKRRIKFSLYASMRYGLGWLVTIILLAVSLIYFQFQGQQPGQEQNIVRQTMINSAVALTNSTIKWKLPQYDPNLSLDDFIKVMGVGSLKVEDLNLAAELEGLSEKEVQKLLQEQIELSEQMLTGAALAETRNELLKRFDIQAKGTDTMNTVMTKILEKYIDRFVLPFQKYLPLIIALSLFLILSIFTPVLALFIKLLALLFFYILIWTGFAVKEKVQIEVERVGIKS